MDTRKKLLRCALRELERNGLEGFSLRAVGAAAGMSAMAIYRHYENKEALLRAIGEEAFASFLQRFQTIPDAPIERWLAAATRVYVEFALDEPEHYEACFVLRTQVERIYPEDFRAGKSPVFSRFVERFRAAQEDGLFADQDPVELTMLVWSQLHGLVMLNRAGRFSLPAPQFVAFCVRATERFVLSHATPARPGKRRTVKGIRSKSRSHR